jgi:putative nucleotidyltransferase with HDIG domain
VRPVESQLLHPVDTCVLVRPPSDAVRVSLDALLQFHPGVARTFAGLDVETRAHLRRVCHLAAGIASLLDLSPADQQAAAVGGLLHDLGKSFVPDTVLQKAAALDPEELGLVRLHPACGAELARSFGDASVLDAIRHHHERLDGTGYPDGLEAAEVTKVTRVVAVADTYDALTSDRPYRAALPQQEAFRQLLQVAGTKLDPDTVDALLLLEAHAGSRAA